MLLTLEQLVDGLSLYLSEVSDLLGAGVRLLARCRIPRFRVPLRSLLIVNGAISGLEVSDREAEAERIALSRSSGILGGTLLLMLTA